MRYLLIILSLTFLNANWKLENYVDEFGDEISSTYITNKSTIRGSYDNSVSNYNDLKVSFVISKDRIKIKLFHHGNYALPLKDGDNYIQHNIKIKHNGEVISFKDIRHSDDAIIFENTYYEETHRGEPTLMSESHYFDLVKLLLQDEKLKFIINSYQCYDGVCLDYSSGFSTWYSLNEYSFELDADGFSDLYKESNPTFDFEAEEKLWNERNQRYSEYSIKQDEEIKRGDSLIDSFFEYPIVTISVLSIMAILLASI